MKRVSRKAKARRGKPRRSTARSSTPRRTKSLKPVAAPTDAVAALVASGAEALRLPLDPTWRAGVEFNLRLILRHAALVEEFALPDEAEPAPVFDA